MRPISIEGFEKPRVVAGGAAPMLQWLRIVDLVIDPTYQRPIVGRGRKNVDRIARDFSWPCFAPVVVSPVEGGKFAIIDGQHRTTAAALVGLETVPCQVVIAERSEQAAAFKAINGITTPISRIALHAAGLVAGDSQAKEIADVCARAEVEILRYPIPTDKQAPGQTMAVGALANCLKRYGKPTLVTALQCITQTTNNSPGAINALTIKALCAVLHENLDWRDSGLKLLETFDTIDLKEMQKQAAGDAALERIGKVSALCERIRNALTPILHKRAARPQDRLRLLERLPAAT